VIAWLGDVAARYFWWCAIIGFLVAIAFETMMPARATLFPALRWVNHILIYAACLALASQLDPAQVVMALIPAGAPVPFRTIHAIGGDAAVLLAGILLLDLVVYAIHRLQHTFFPLWRFHAVHHSDTEVDASTALRHHPLAYLMVAMLVSILLPLLGMPLWVFAVYGVLLFIAALFQHLNARLPVRLEQVLQLVIVCSDMHRLHHSTSPEHYNFNFGNVFSVWDRLFGTYRSTPANARNEIRFGLGAGLDQPSEFLSPWTLPFTLRRPKSAPVWPSPQLWRQQ
jgi:sterol desaturase/sphingolipid hydroxylase (fatty acid hydroxylase superfamily)